MENSQKVPKLNEEKNEIFNESKIQWEIPKFEEIELESGKRPLESENSIYRS
jgi:hypothetical protein